MTVPGPTLLPWTLALVVFAAASALLGGAVRTFVRRWVPMWRTLGPIERLVLDLYLGGGTVYAVALLPFGLFGTATFPVLLGLALAYLAYDALRRGRRSAGAAAERAVRRYLTPGPAIALATAAALGLLEIAIAVPVPTGNTWDASQLGTYTGLLIAHGSIPATLSGAGLALPVVYPQGSAVWMGTAQLLFGLPAARTALLVTPLFLGLAPLGGYAVGDRWFGGERAGAVVAVAFGLLGTWTRYQVTGSYDFVLSFPLLLLVVALSKEWLGPEPVRWSDAVAFGLVAGYSAALNPVGAGWWLLALPIAAGIGSPEPWSGRAAGWFARFGAAIGAALVPILPFVASAFAGLGHLGFSTSEPGVGTIAPVGLSGPAIVGYVDPFLFRPNAIWLSPFPALQIELAGLLVLGGTLLALRIPRPNRIAPLAVAGLLSAAAWFALEGLAGLGVPIATALAPLSNGDELAELLATVYLLVACGPLVALFPSGRPSPRVVPPSNPVRRARRPFPPVAALALGVLLMVPGVAVTATELPSNATTLYHDFGDVSPDDFALLAWAPGHLPGGARVLVAPGSAAEFLTAYDPSLRVLYPMVLGFDYPNATYRALVDQLQNGSLGSNGSAELRALDVEYVAVTGANTVLAAPFQPAPFLARPSEFPVAFESGDAFVFALGPPPAGGSA